LSSVVSEDLDSNLVITKYSRHAIFCLPQQMTNVLIKMSLHRHPTTQNHN